MKDPSIEDMMYIMYVLLVLMVLLVIATVLVGQDAEKYKAEHHCVLIHSNPDETRLEYNVPLKMMTPVTHSGHKFYQCDNDEWKVY